MPARAEFCLLGPLVVRCAGVAVPVPQRRQRALLATLLLHPGRAFSAARLAELLWEPAEPPPSAEVTVRNYVKRLRRALAAAGLDRIVTSPGGYLIRVEPGELDITVMQQALAAAHDAARQGDWQQAGQHADAALLMWRGEPLADVDLPELAAKAGRLAELRLQADELRVEAGLRLGGHTELLPELRQLAAASPLREQLHGLLILALYRSGRRADALAAYQAARGLLVNELGSEPGPELQALHRQVLTDDPALTVPGPSSANGPLGLAARREAPRQLPAVVGGFTGRAAELAALTGLLGGRAGAGTQTMVISAIGGTAGVGKTALAIRWAHQVASTFPDGQLYVNLRGYDPGRPVSPAEALAGFLAALGVPSPQVPPDLDGRTAAYRSALAGRRVLIVLDNARDAEQVRSLLPGEPGCLVVVTSRDALAGLVARDGARRVPLDVLPPDEAVALLRELIGQRVAAEPDAAARLADFCCRLPLALRVAAELAAARPELTLAALAAELDGQGRLDVLEAGGDPATAVRVVFSWSCSHLSAGAARAFRLAALHPGADFGTHAVAALTGTSHQEAARTLAELVRASLIQQAGMGRYSMHDLLRSYAAELASAQDADNDRREAVTRLLDHYLYAARRAASILFPVDTPALDDEQGSADALVFSDAPAARAWIDAEQANLMAATAHAGEHGWPRHAISLSVSLFRYLEAGGFLADALVIHSAAARAATQVGDRAAEAEAIHNLGTVYLTLGRYREAEQHLQCALKLSHEVGDHLGELRALLNLSQLYLFNGDHSSATASCQQALELSRATGDRAREARSLLNLGRLAIRQGRYRQAAAWLLEASEASRRAGDRFCLIFSLFSLGETEVRCGRFRQARGHLQEARTTARQAGHALADARVTGLLGLADLREGRYQGAAEQLQEALAECQDAGTSASEADMLCWLGELDLRLGCAAQAASRYRRALDIYREAPEPSGESEARNGLGEAARAQGALRDARVHHEAALAIACTISPQQQARAHDGLGDIDAAEGDAAGARAHWQEALDLYVQMEVPEAERVRAKLSAMGNVPAQARAPH
ncbi:MAG TPA: BTAD domain-containing putative transcriptional regulator [Streptosporangiaceae bacterium]|nr:BTAD domain-containing putative transcriptional regulator [Streptosporangiaceae bacterium]